MAPLGAARQAANKDVLAAFAAKKRLQARRDEAWAKARADASSGLTAKVRFAKEADTRLDDAVREIKASVARMRNIERQLGIERQRKKPRRRTRM